MTEMEFILNSVLGILTDTTFFLGLVVLTICLLLRYVVVDRSHGLPPGPWFRLPLIGNMYAAEPDMRKFLRRYRKKYGDVYSLYFGNKFVIIISGFDKLKEAFVKNGDVFSDRPKVTDIMAKIADGKGIVNVDGDLWREHRKFGLTTLKSFGMGKSVLEDRIHAIAKLLIMEIKSKESNPFNPEKLIYMSVSNVMNSLSFGGHFKFDDARCVDMLDRLHENLTNITFSGIGLFIPALAYLPGDMFRIKRALKNAEVVYGWLREFVNEHLEKYDENNITNYTSAFIKEMKRQEVNKGTTTFTVEQLVHVLGDFFVAGSETTSSILRWALVYLVNYPDIQEEIFSNIRDVVGNDHFPSLQDKAKLPLVDAFMYECLRHANLLFTSIGHATSHNVTFCGYLIPREATILADMDSINNDKAIWKDPEVFRPQRFIDDNGLFFVPEEFIPFFLGRRSCLGESLARMEMFLFLSAIVQNFRISAPPGEDLSLDKLDSFGLTHAPKSYSIVAIPREKLPS